MASIVIRKLDDSVKVRLQNLAAQHGRSMEEEAREILRCALASPSKSQKDLFERIHARFAAIGGFDMPKIPREPMREPPAFG